jgi:hypothetical protein
MSPRCFRDRRLTLEQADDQHRAPLGRPALDFFPPLLVCYLPPLWCFDLVLLVVRFPRVAGYDEENPRPRIEEPAPSTWANTAITCFARRRESEPCDPPGDREAEANLGLLNRFAKVLKLKYEKLLMLAHPDAKFLLGSRQRNRFTGLGLV